MATALAKGILRSGIVGNRQLVASDPSAGACEAFAEGTGARTTADNLEIAREAEVVFLAVKPGQLLATAREIRSALNAGTLVISIAAGIPTRQIEEALAEGTRVIRVMPNTPALVGASASAFALGRSATREDAERVRTLLSAVGLALEVQESWLDAVTGLSGSGPAYVFMVIEALSDGGVAAGLPRDVATRLAAQTVVGAGRMVLETGLHPGCLKDMVTSPGGTTIEGVHELEKAGVRAALIGAVRAAADKARRLSQA